MLAFTGSQADATHTVPRQNSPRSVGANEEIDQPCTEIAKQWHIT